MIAQVLLLSSALYSNFSVWFCEMFLLGNAYFVVFLVLDAFSYNEIL